MALIIVAEGGNLILFMFNFMKPWSVLMFSATGSTKERLLLSPGGSPAFRVKPYKLKSCREAH